MTIHINWDRAEEVFSILLRAWDNRSYPYRTAFDPHDVARLPRTMLRDGVEHANFLFCSCYYMRGGIRSDIAIGSLTKLYHRVPRIFNPAWSADRDENYAIKTVSSALKENGLAYHADEIARFWVVNFRKLHTDWGGDIRQIFVGATSYEELCRRIMSNGNKPDSPNGFHGFREKMTSMIIYFLADSGLIDEFHFPIPVDFHVMRVMVANQILVPETGFNDGDAIGLVELQRAARELTLKYCQKHGVSTLRLCDAFWHLSREGCARNLGNKSSEGENRARKTEVTPHVITWNTKEIHAFDAGCGRCPVNSFCTWNIPPSNYYRTGIILLRGKRPVPPQEKRIQYDLF